MSKPINQWLFKEVEKRKSQHSLRELSIIKDAIDFFSNDYLGVASDHLLKNFIDTKNTSYKASHQIYGSTGSRLLSGNYPQIVELEQKIASFHKAEAALCFNSGYNANLGLLSSVASRDSTVIYDELCHASILDGIRLCQARKKFKFKHNNIKDLQKKLEFSTRKVFIVVESVYSMDGDIAPLKSIAQISDSISAGLIIDEAHAIGVFGNEGEGISQHQDIWQHTLARVYTYGKAAGAHGASVVGSSLLKTFLINTARPFIYTTALPLHAVTAIEAFYSFLKSKKSKEKRCVLKALISHFKNCLVSFPKLNLVGDEGSPIQAVLIGNEKKAKEISDLLVRKGFSTKPILPPTVPKGTSRIRICIHAFNTEKEITDLTSILSSTSI